MKWDVGMVLYACVMDSPPDFHYGNCSETKRAVLASALTGAPFRMLCNDSGRGDRVNLAKKRCPQSDENDSKRHTYSRISGIPLHTELWSNLYGLLQPRLGIRSLHRAIV
jgi:hypothetical protein